MNGVAVAPLVIDAGSVQPSKGDPLTADGRPAARADADEMLGRIGSPGPAWSALDLPVQTGQPADMDRGGALEGQTTSLRLYVELI